MNSGFSNMIYLNDLQFGFSRKLPLYLQTEAAECGLACLAMIASYHGFDTDLPSLRRRFSISLKGATLSHLIDIAAAIELASRPLRLELEELKMLQTPSILHWDLNHFVVLKRVQRGQITIHDPASGARTLLFSEVSRHFTGVALELTPTPAFRKRRESQEIRLREMMGKVVGLKRSLTQILLLALGLEIFALVAPFFNQWVVDQAIVTGDRDLLLTLALGFGLLMIIQVATEAIRGWAVTIMSTTLSVQWLANVFKHLTSLPIPYFEKRHMGDILSRFNGINVIQNTLTTSFVEAMLDGLMTVGTLAMMLIYSPALTAISVVAVFVYALLRVALYGGLRLANQKEIVFAAKQQTLFMESVRGIQSIRLFSKGEERVSRWMNVVVDQKNCSLRTQRLMLVFKTCNHFLFGLENILVIFFGATAVLDATFSVGMLFAYLSYKTQFSQRVSSLIDKMYEVKMLQIHGARLADIVLTEPEHNRAGNVVAAEEIVPAIKVRNLRFRYSEEEPYVLNHVDLTINAGESVAIVGPSGCGKTTLVKVLLGLHPPTSGKVLVGGISIRNIGLSNYRKMVGAVMQEDQLFAGSMADNICFFAQTPDRQLIQSCAKQAALHEEIKAMPMGYNTLIGDMGTVLSGGQKQRLLLARALYQKPKILFLDEATSHLDVSNESRVNEAIRRLQLTRIVIAHRKETIASADRIISLDSINSKSKLSASASAMTGGSMQTDPE